MGGDVSHPLLACVHDGPGLGLVSESNLIILPTWTCYVESYRFHYIQLIIR
jgi:hypothetical protein